MKRLEGVLTWRILGDGVIRGIALKNGSKFGDRGSSWVSISGARSPGSGGVLKQLYGMDGEGREGLSMSRSLLVHLLGIGH